MLLQFHDTLHAIHISRVSRKQITLGTRFPTDREEDLRKEVEKKSEEGKKLNSRGIVTGAERDDSVKYRARIHAALSRRWKKKRDAKIGNYILFSFIFLKKCLVHLVSRPYSFLLYTFYPNSITRFYSPAKFALTISYNYKLLYRMEVGVEYDWMIRTFLLNWIDE